MNITMIDKGLTNFFDLKRFLNGVPDITFFGTSKKEKYEWVKEILNRFDFRHLKKGDRGTVREYIQKVTGYSNAQTSRLICKYLAGKLYFIDYQRYSFPTKYAPVDIALLCKTDNIHNRLNGFAQKNL